MAGNELALRRLNVSALGRTKTTRDENLTMTKSNGTVSVTLDCELGLPRVFGDIREANRKHNAL